MKTWKIDFYLNKRGDSPVQEFIRKQDKDVKAKFVRYVDLVEKNGPNLGIPYSKYIYEGIYELRIRGKNEVRIFYICISKLNTIYFIHAFNKRTQKIPSKELKIAKNRQEELTHI